VKKLACIVVVIVAAFALLVPAGRAGAADDEHILSFDSVVTVHTDCTIAVQETITCVSAGSSIQHSLYRDVPTTSTDPANGRADRFFSQPGL